MIKITDTVKHLIIINVILWVATQMALPQLQNLFALHTPTNSDFGIWQYITSMFMHDQKSLSHLAFNMFGLWMFGSALEQVWGRNKFLFFYFSTGIGAGLFYTAINYFQFNGIFNDLLNAGASANDINSMLASGESRVPAIVQMPRENIQKFFNLFHSSLVGASGALFGLIAGFGMRFPNARMSPLFLPISVAAKYMVLGIITIEIISAFYGNSLFGNTQIAYTAHIGGALTGFIIMLFWKKSDFKRWN